MFILETLSEALRFFLIVMLVWLAFLFFKAQKRQERRNEKTDGKMREILQEVQFTNKRLILLEEWRKTLTSQMEDVYEYSQFMRDRVDGLLTKITKEEDAIVKEGNNMDWIISPTAPPLQVKNPNILLRIFGKMARKIKSFRITSGWLYY